MEIPVVLYCVIAAPKKLLLHGRPLRPYRSVKEEQDFILFVGPGLFLEERTELVLPALATLLACAALQCLSKDVPLLRPVLHHLAEQFAVFFHAPHFLLTLVLSGSRN